MMNIKTYNEYVDSHTDWIGKIPSTWRILKSKHIFDRVNNRTQTGDEELLSVSEYYGVKPKKETIKEGEFISRSDSLINYKKCSRNDLVMNIMLAWKKGLGISDYDGIVSPAYEVFNLNTEIVFPKYIDYLFRTDMYTTEFKRHSYGVIDSRLRLYPDNFKEIECILPPIKEQEQIVAFLNSKIKDIDNKITTNEKLIQLLEEKKSSLIYYIITKGLNPDTQLKDSNIDIVGQIPYTNNIIRLKFLCDIKTGDKDTINRDPNGKYPFYVRSPNIERINSYSFDGEAILMAGDGVGAGKVFHYVNGKFDYHQRVYNLHNFRNIYPKYLYYYISSLFSIEIEKGSAKSTVDSVRLPMLENFLICFPDIDEQKNIVDYLDNKISKIDNIINEVNGNINLLEEYKDSLIYQVVTGKIDIRGEVI